MQRKMKPKQYLDRMDKLTQRLNKRLNNGKIKSKLIKGKNHLPGFGYWFHTK